jgi:chromosome segregation ATPase
MKIHVVKAARKETVCSKCGKKIEIGKSYRWWQHAFRAPTKWHIDHGHPRQSDLTTSDKMSRIYSAQETLEDLVSSSKSLDTSIDEGDELDVIVKRVKDEIESNLEELNSQMEEAAGEMNDVAEEYREGAENIREHFGDTSQTDEMDSKADALEEWASELESFDVEEPDDPEPDESISDWMDATESWLSDKVDEADEKIGSLSI